MAYTAENVAAKAAALMGETLSAAETAALTENSAAVIAELNKRLKVDITPEIMGDTYLTAAGLLSAARFARIKGKEGMTSFKAGMVTVSRSAGAVSELAESMTAQAEALLRGYVSDRDFAFLGVPG